MKTDGLFTIKVVDVSFQHYNKPIKLWFPCDEHFNSSNHAKSSFDDFLLEAKDKQYQNIFLHLGDSLDTCSASERKYLRASSLHDDTEEQLENLIERDTDRFIAKIAPTMKDRTIGVIGGNHYWKFEDGTTTEQRIARGLNAPYLGDASFIALVLRYKNSAYTHEVLIFAHHASSDAKLKKLGARVEADIVVGAHTHHGFVDPIPKLRLKREGRTCSLQHHVTRVVRGKSFLRSYVDGKRSYAVSAGYAPTEIGCSSAIITPRRHAETRWIDIKAVI